MHDMLSRLKNTDFPALTRDSLQTLQVNLGYLCNQRCVHCHVNAGPKRTEIMDEQTARLIPDVLKAREISTLDLTGGAPEMNPQFRLLVSSARALGVHVIDRCNLTILLEPGFEWLAEFLAEQEVEVIASLPCYLQENVDRQRGKGVFAQSIEALRLLNRLGYGGDDARLPLSLVYNPLEPRLPPDQQTLEHDYKRELGRRFGIRFTRLIALTNMPINRFGSMLVSQGTFETYLRLLKDNFCSDNLRHVMCRKLISVDWQGYLYDCDFNQMLNLRLRGRHGAELHLRDLLEEDLAGRPIRVLEHCYGCTAGQGSSCSGALAS
ncbi:MAG: radical SAM/Cys-rich domain protein [Zetaproteobacteria bacterium]|nr:MAG: radical SAM/Cys-rich domain protein [Zetaproteobacteria bacterium]